MIAAAQLVRYRTSSDDYGLTEDLKAQFARLRDERHPLYLTSEEFDKILHWKLGGNMEDNKRDVEQIQKR